MRSQRQNAASADEQTLARSLLERRDRFIAERIDATLKPWQSGIIFLGVLHSLSGKLAPDIEVVELFSGDNDRNAPALRSDRSGIAIHDFAAQLPFPTAVSSGSVTLAAHPRSRQAVRFEHYRGGWRCRFILITPPR